jgi:ADP-ribosyl-[dinitrogen reductase] hydrolase
MLIDSDVDRFRGVLLGGAVGDALGAPLEGMSATEIRLMHGGRVRNFLPGRYGAGAFSGDTQLTMALAEALVAGGRFDMDEVSHAFGEWMRLDDEGVREARGHDHDSMKACRRLYRGVPARVGAVDSDGRGAAARAAPLGLFLRDAEVADAAVLQAMLTHAGPRALGGAVAVAVGVAHALSAVPFDSFGFLRATALAVEDVEPGLAAKISNLEEYVEEPLHEGLEYTGTGASATEAVPAALLVFAQIPHDTEEALVTAVNAGGEAAGIGSMVGALAGTLNGAESLPGRWLARLEARERIERLAEALYWRVRGTNGRMTG